MLMRSMQRLYIGNTKTNIQTQHRSTSRHFKPNWMTTNHYLFSSTRKHTTDHGYTFNTTNFSIIDSFEKINLPILETLHIYTQKYNLNTMQSAVPLRIVAQYVSRDFSSRLFDDAIPHRPPSQHSDGANARLCNSSYSSSLTF